MSKPKQWIDVWSWENSKKQIIEFLDLCEDSPGKVLENAGLNRDLYYQLKDSRRQSAPLRASTIQKLSEALNIPFVFMGNFPFFGNVLLSSREGQDMTSILSTAIRRELRVEILAYKVGLAPSDITEMIQSKDLKISVPIPLFEKLSQALDMEITAYADNSIGLLASNEEIGRFDTFIDFQTMNKIVINIQEYYVKLRDEGLRELLSEQNQKKYSITSSEIDDLTHIESHRNSNSTVSQWVAILYAIRSLES
ncbi:MAG: hypothetical protein HOB84_08760 [Candidatus Marinimicrobia bacterium]|jgi:hypothetical protein|nr:hypothetical protein [Candidatus Neomarinimicrobiota bacterium]MBT4360973.1 hypothetical protein [Candidatus Neomarinimicrobiota bacterium]MBT4714850.1 hypothetical protein [Candidatus Neomarinimicrobiota bacterium]MBT4947296.1 hypothetical protein [Candidatus Neomarinimicrobiota bacterium]MBT5268203.1 hypothetical protein [Candidatus Neomarinimicrobiota bacterium]